MRVIMIEELTEISGGDASATRVGNVNSWGEEYASSYGRYDILSKGCVEYQCREAMYNLTH